MLRIALAVTAGFATTPAAALSLGPPEIASYLGQPLLLRVPAILDDPSDDATQCLRIVGQQGEDIPSLTVGRIEVERTQTGNFLRVTTPQPVDEPVLRVVLEIGCLQRVRREFTLLLDPPPAVTSGQQVAAQQPDIEFGTPEVIGVRGQPLLVNVPLYGDLVPSLSSACVRTGRSDSAEVPRVLNDARVTLIDRDGARSLRIHTPEPVNDARVRVLVEVGCDRYLQREFLFQLETPQLATTAEEQPQAAAAPAPPPVKRPPKPAPRPQAAPPPPKPAPPAVPAPPPAPAEPPLAKQTAEQPIEPARLPPREPPGKTDRLVLAAPDETPRREGPSERDTEVLKRLDELAAEVKNLRAELDASAVRNRELAEKADKADSASYAWAIAAVTAVLLGLVIVFARRRRPAEEDTRPEPERTGPMTRILGQSQDKAPVTPLPKFTDGAGPATIAAIAAAHKSAHEQDTQGTSTAIMVTEFRDTTQVIGELYSPYIEKGPATHPGPATRPGPVTHPAPATQAGPSTKTEGALDLDLGQERTTALSPQTKTEIAVDIDLFERNSQIGRDLQREYEKLDRAVEAQPPAPPPPKPPEADPASVLDSTTMPLTTRLSLDLDLDMPTVSKPKTPPDDA
ncbi:MAG TPA: hypothetical protein VMG60_17765 [Burkholderiaceae bacterium]|nr:hypothetical protein [Burkholderiaceae bacterium]